MYYNIIIINHCSDRKINFQNTSSKYFRKISSIFLCSKIMLPMYFIIINFVQSNKNTNKDKDRFT